MKLSTRLVLLILGCLLPILAAQLFSQANLAAERQDQQGELLLRQAETASATMAGIVDALQQLAPMAAGTLDSGWGSTACTDRLSALQRSLPRYRFLGLYVPMDGRVACASSGGPVDVSAGGLPWITDMLTTRGLTLGQPTSVAGDADAVLPVAIRVPNAVGDGKAQVLLVGLSVAWLSNYLQVVPAASDNLAPAASIFITEADGTILYQSGLYQSGNGVAPAAAQLPGWLRPLLARDTAGRATVMDPNGQAHSVGYVPNLMSPAGVGVVVESVLPNPIASLWFAGYHSLLVIIAAAGIATLLAYLAGRRFIFRPTEALLQAARRWREGDLGARASLTNADVEFAALSQSFNAMAAGLEARETERRLQAEFLETQVAERTRELSESNNRLQVAIAGREKTEAALHQAQKLQAVGQLAGGIAHDFNNMLATVLGNLELMERRVSQAINGWSDSDTDRLLKLIERAGGAVQRGGQLTSHLLAFSRRQRLAARPTDLNALLRELITLATSTLGRRIQVIPELAPVLWPAMVDPSQVEAAILNLCLNARDAMREGGRLTITTSNVTIDPAKALSAVDGDLLPGAYVRVCISDTGTGMTPEVKARAFDPFFTTKGPGIGSGLGLSQVYGMARQSGGSVTIESTVGEGTRVTLSLPCAVEPEAASQPAIQLTSRPTGLPADLILVVDDDHAVRQVTVEMARDLGYEVAQAAGGDQALALVAKLNPQPKFILLDYAMPGMNGLQLARALRDRGVIAPIALVTGYAELSDGDITAAELAGLLRKPFTIRELQVLLEQLRAVADADAAETAELEPGLIDS